LGLIINNFTMIFKRKNPNANPNNALKLGTNLEWCCGDTDATTACLWQAIVGVASSVTFSTITIGSTEVAFETSVDVVAGASAATLKSLEAQIQQALISTGYTPDGVYISLDANNLTIRVGYSTGVITSIKTGSVQYAFEGIKCVPAKVALDKEVRGGPCGPADIGGDVSDGEGFIEVAIGKVLEANFASGSADDSKVTAASWIVGTDLAGTAVDLTSSITGGLLEWTAAGTANDQGFIRLVGANGCELYIPVKLLAGA